MSGGGSAGRIAAVPAISQRPEEVKVHGACDIICHRLPFSHQSCRADHHFSACEMFGLLEGCPHDRCSGGCSHVRLCL